MTNRPALYWSLFTLCLLLIIPAMVWLTYSVLGLDQQMREDRRQTELARREVELQEKITSALYRMDWKLGPHIAREAAQPYYAYDSFYKFPNNDAVMGQGSSNAQADIPSPLMYEEAEFVKLHFQVDADGAFTSPKRPTSKSQIQQAATCCDINSNQLFACDAQLTEIRKFSSFESLLAKLNATASQTGNEQRISQLVYSEGQIEKVVADKLQELVSSNASGPQSASPKPSAQISKSLMQNQRVQSRGKEEFLKRNSAYIDNAGQWAAGQRQIASNFGNATNNAPATQESNTSELLEGVMRPIWVEDQLILARTVEMDGRTRIQGCWLDWEKIQQSLRDEVRDIIPAVNFAPLKNNDQLVPGRALVTLPAQVVVDAPAMLASLAFTNTDVDANSASGAPLALLLAWLGLAFSAVAVGLLLFGIIRLSERRAAFVSAVTHELRTPLTTFKMYSEMLADEMVPPEKQKHYANTLTQQADRLSHLVENVLQFARLERGSENNQSHDVVLSEELERIAERLKQRCRLSKMNLDVEVEQAVVGQSLKLNIHALEQVLFNLVDNACKYASHADNKTVQLCIAAQQTNFEFSVRDFGPGIAPKFRRRLFQPFCKSDDEAANSAAGVGLGLALCKRMAASLGGRLQYVEAQPGAKFVLTIPSSGAT